MKALPLLLTALALSACVTVSKTVLTHSHVDVPVAKNLVHVYLANDTLPAHERVALLHARGDENLTDESDLIDKLREAAGKLGANAIVLGEIKDAGTAERVAAVVLHTSANRRGQAIAIYVPTRKLPNFSGTWTIDKAQTRLQALNIDNLDSARVTIRQSADSLAFTRYFVVRGQPNTFSYTLPLDSTASVRRMDSQTMTSRMYWSDDALVFDTRIEEPRGNSTNVVHYRLSFDGQTITAEERRRGVESYDNHWVFRRVPR